MYTQATLLKTQIIQRATINTKELTSAQVKLHITINL